LKYAYASLDKLRLYETKTNEQPANKTDEKTADSASKDEETKV